MYKPYFSKYEDKKVNHPRNNPLTVAVKVSIMTIAVLAAGVVGFKEIKLEQANDLYREANKRAVAYVGAEPMKGNPPCRECHLR